MFRDARSASHACNFRGDRTAGGCDVEAVGVIFLTAHLVMSRPKKFVDEKQICRVTLRFTQTESEGLHIAASAAHLPLASFIRAALLDGTPPPPAPTALTADQRAALADLNGILSNLSQVGSHALAAGWSQTATRLERATLAAADLKISVAAGDSITIGLADAGRRLNALARALNEGQKLAPEAWLEQMRPALELLGAA